LIAAGHPPVDVWSYSPRQAFAFTVLSGHRQKEDDARDMVNVFYGSNVDGKKLDEIRKELMRGF
jgi:hypothetical protein